VQLLSADNVEGKRFSIVSREGEGPGQNEAAWERLFEQAHKK